MQLGPSSQISDGLMAAMALLSEKPHQGVPTSTHTMYPGFGFVISNTALGMQPVLYDEGVGSRYTNKERDAETGNDYFTARYYNSSTGRFLSPDWSAKVEPVPYAKLENPQSLNLYSYVLNNPLYSVDVDGHAGCQLEGVDTDCNNVHSESTVAVQGMDSITVKGKATKWWNIGSKIKSLWDKGSKLHNEIKEADAWGKAAKRDRDLIDNYDPIQDAMTGSGSPTGESLNLIQARYKYEFAVATQGYLQVAKDMVHDTDSFGLPESRLGGAAVEQMRTLTSGFADGSISNSVRGFEQQYVEAYQEENIHR